MLRALLVEMPAEVLRAARDPLGDLELEWVRLGLEEQCEEGDGGEPELRGPAAQHDIEEIMSAVGQEWPETEWLSLLPDAELMRQTGAALASAVTTAPESVTDPDSGTLRDGEDPGWLRVVIRQRLRDLDRVVGAAVQAVAGRLNQSLRTRFIPGTTRFFGDVLVYQRHQAAIHARIRSCIERVDPQLGRSQAHPARVVAHSLGGVIAVDMATSLDPLWVSSLLTFGSQSAFFHVCDPRGGQLAPYLPEQLTQLPASVGEWTNLWEPLDMLAFIAASVFRLHDGTFPMDVAVGHEATAGLWTHSVYWDLPILADRIRAMAK
ncbi:hypothetical protein B6R96_10480 [Streptomyces sp. Sge12]|nr:hypothetical protein B6R96_10480 [Streptomyces sp. Sge12]